MYHKKSNVSQAFLVILLVLIGYSNVWGQNEKAKENKTTSVSASNALEGKDYVFTILTFDKISPKQIGSLEAQTSNLIALQNQLRRDLLTQLRDKKLLPPAKSQLIRLLGSLRAEEATFDLIKEINFQDGPEQFLPNGTIRGGYVARRALVQIGTFAANAIMGNIECTNKEVVQCFDKTLVDGMAIVLHDIRGPKPALRGLQERQAKVTHPTAKAQYQLVIDRLKFLFPDVGE